MGDGPAFVRDDGNRQAHDGELFFISPTVHRVDVALEAIVPVIEIRNHQVKSFDNGLANLVNMVRSAHEDKVIASDVSHEALRPS